MSLGLFIFTLIFLVMFPYGVHSATKSIAIDYSLPRGEINLIVGTNTVPDVWNSACSCFINIAPQLHDIGITQFRTHDIGNSYGKTSHPTDWYDIFPLWSADSQTPASYNFTNSDSKISLLKNNDFDIFYRLGVSWAAAAPYLQPPADFDKWADICLHIVMHYNDGWHNGFHHNIRYWEVWNEPDATNFWTGTAEQFRQMYAATARRLKQYNPTLKIGGLAISDITRMDYVEDFIAYCAAHSVPLDFYSFHRYGYGGGSKSFSRDVRRIRSVLDANGFQAAEIFCNEWNLDIGFAINGCTGSSLHNTALAAAYVTSALAHFIETNITGVNYFPPANCWGQFDAAGEYRKEGYAFKLFKQFRTLTPVRLEASPLLDEDYGYIAARSYDGKTIQILVGNETSDYNQFHCDLQNLPPNLQGIVSYTIIDASNTLIVQPGPSVQTTDALRAITIDRNIPAPSVCLITVTMTGSGIDGNNPRFEKWLHFLRLGSGS